LPDCEEDEMSEPQREYNLCPGCGRTSTAPRLDGWKHGGISWHDGCLGKPSLLTKDGFAVALEACATKQEEFDLLAAYDRLKGNRVAGAGERGMT
jgi:hypothetical protein